MRWEIKRPWSMRRVDVVAIVIDILGSVNTKLPTWLEIIGASVRVKFLQKSTLHGATRILRRDLEE